MITFDSISSLEATENENISLGMLKEITQNPSWVRYNDERSDFHQLVERFLKNHARVPGALTPSMLATVPLAVFRFPMNFKAELNMKPALAEGVLFKNGAVVKMTQDGQLLTGYLFMDASTRSTWGYPKDFIVPKNKETGPNTNAKPDEV